MSSWSVLWTSTLLVFLCETFSRVGPYEHSSCVGDTELLVIRGGKLTRRSRSSKPKHTEDLFMKQKYLLCDCLSAAGLITAPRGRIEEAVIQFGLQFFHYFLI